MAEEENGAVEEQIEMVFEGAQPTEDLESYLAVEAKATFKVDGGDDNYKAAKGFFKFGADLAEATQMFTEEVVFSNFRAQAKIKLQALMRSRILKGGSVPELLASWKPGIQLERVPQTPEAAIETNFDRLTDEEKLVLLQKLQERVG